MRRIPLTQKQYAIVDDADYDWLNQYKWFASKNRRGNFYAARMIPIKNSKKRQYEIKMAREILGLKCGEKRQADHINHNTLDNRRDKLRIGTHSQNQWNQKPQRNRTSRFKGVCWDKRYEKWYVRIHIKRKAILLGYFEIEEQAALAYNEGAKKYFGEFAFLNKI